MEKTGPDELPAESLKALGERNIEITSLCNIILQQRNDANRNETVCIITLPKKPKAMICREFRTVSLINPSIKFL